MKRRKRWISETGLEKDREIWCRACRTGSLVHILGHSEPCRDLMMMEILY